MMLREVFRAAESCSTSRVGGRLVTCGVSLILMAYHL